MKVKNFAIAAVVLGLVPVTVRAQDLGIDVGARAPAVAVQSLDGKTFSLGNYIGKTPVLLEFWATWCPNCRELMPTLLEAEKKFGKRVKFVAIAVAINQSPERVRRFLAAHPLPHDTFYDVEGKAAGALGDPSTPNAVAIERAGRGEYAGLGGKQRVNTRMW